MSIKRGFKVVREVVEGDDVKLVSPSSLVPVSYLVGQSVGRPIVKVETNGSAFVFCGPLTVFSESDDAVAYKEDMSGGEDSEKGKLVIYSCFYTPSKESALWVWVKEGTGVAEASPFPGTIFADSVSLIEEVR